MSKALQHMHMALSASALALEAVRPKRTSHDKSLATNLRRHLVEKTQDRKSVV